MKAIEAAELTKFYGKTRGIENLNLSVEEGDFFGFIGPNGAGKSTCIRTLLGLIKPTSGTARVLGADIRGDRREYLKNVGYMSGEAIFHNGLRAGEVIKLSADLRSRDCSAEARKLCELLELDTKKRVEELSLGNRKKLAVVCAMQHEPRLYILDEPTSGLDPLMQRTFFELLREKNAAGATVFISSHVLSEVQHNCRRAAIIRGGRIAECDAFENLARRGARRVSILGLGTLPEGLEAVNLTQNGEGLSFLYTGRIPDLISALNGLPVKDLTVTEPELEEIFLHYYERGEGA